jgi:hypothetical protein
MRASLWSQGLLLARSCTASLKHGSHWAGPPSRGTSVLGPKGRGWPWLWMGIRLPSLAAGLLSIAQDL